MLTEEVVAPFDREVDGEPDPALGESQLIAHESDLESADTVTVVTAEARLLCTTLMAKFVDDFQDTAKPALKPKRIAADGAHGAPEIPVPVTVKEVEPVDGLLETCQGRTGEAASTVNALLCVPRRLTALREEGAELMIRSARPTTVACLAFSAV